MKREQGRLLFSPSDLVRFVQSPFASWMQRLMFSYTANKRLAMCAVVDYPIVGRDRIQPKISPIKQTCL
jgi:hypothetical protein